MVHAGLPARRRAPLNLPTPPNLAVLLLRLLARIPGGDGLLRLGGVLAALSNLGLFLLVWSVTPGLPPMMPLHYNGSGVVDVIGPSSDLFKLPLIGTVVLATNAVAAALLASREPPAAQVLVWTALVVQAALGAGIWILVQRAAG